MGRVKDMAGVRVDRLAVVAIAGRYPNGAARWECLCDCGTTCYYAGADLRRGQVHSCGCWNSEVATKRVRTHGGCGTSEYESWVDMHRRCTDPRRRDFCHYGGRGIRICERWGAFETFLADMGTKPDATHVIDRIDPNRGYAPSNCRWQPRARMNSNKRNTVYVTLRDQTKTLIEWSRELGVNYYTAHKRLRRGLPPEQALRP